MPIIRKFRINYTLPGQILQKIEVSASDVNAARSIVQAMFGGKVLVGYIEEIR
jgi:hypothetical protein